MEKRFLGLIGNSIRKNWDLPAFTDYKGKTFYYKDFAEEIEKFRILLEEAGIQKGDKVAIVGRNSSHWAICFFGTLAYGAVIVPILHDFKPESIHHIVNHSEAKALIVASHNWEGMNSAEITHLQMIILMDDFSILASKNEGLPEVQKNIEARFQEKFPTGYGPNDLVMHEEEPEELAVLNYTSGTTSFSKGVMLPYRSLWSNTQMAYDRLPGIHPGDTIVCMLPMAHMYGLAFEVLNSINLGCHIHFLSRTPSPKIIIDAFSTIKPPLILAVPLIIEKIVKNKIFPMLQKPAISILLKVPGLRNIILNIVGNKLKAAFGANLWEVVIGGAALNREVEEFLRKVKFPYSVGYGMTECGPLIAYTQWDSFKMASVGEIVDRMEVMIDSSDPENEVGEILVRGMNVMLGYYKNPTATEEVMMADGWMRTGDLGTLDKDGFLYIKGRSKSLILSSNGQNIYPEEIEDKLNNMLYVSESIVISEKGKIVALIYPDLDRIESLGITDEEVEKQMQANIVKLNTLIPAYSKVSEYRLFDEEFEKTPKRSIKRYLYQPKEE
ncbi:long-chain acyl-CoA synthetase [Parabacteroides sp. PFB2-12]|uniref:AMP-binding protein n=1 Tax=unclassified Parabacteroides TaxID=2649774 RepID=UPI0024755331|nr:MULTISPECIES: AMP-binding protein [unclassified Parabacteroides]MDH6343535.1 long-chain acyl-CoA synthetase [Parabacteroides sp. PM6-13]MDH6390865.1 long-chain acyl-CoA synthetase [Parabacteroides sp. PFB2-12]